MPYSYLNYTSEAQVVTVTLNRPEVKNALNSPMRVELLDAIRQAQEDARVMVLRGAGGSFCSGQDLSEVEIARDNDIGRILREEYEPILIAMHESRIPIIAAVEGAAAGAGANLALAADVVIAAESAFFMQAFTAIGLIPDAGGTYWLPRQIGFARAMGAALFADRIPARQAAEWGMIWETVEDHAFEAQLARRIARLAYGPALALRLTKQALRESFDRNLLAQLALEAEFQAAAGNSEDFAEGVAAVLQKRPAKFEGR